MMYWKERENQMNKLLSERVRTHFITTGDTKVSVVQKDMWADEIAALEADNRRLRERVAELEKARAHQLTDVLMTPDQSFRDWVASLPETYWAKKDLSACRLGWDAGVKYADECSERCGPNVHDPYKPGEVQ
jgi:hypothetical protein